ncbi:winged helix DNA-binding domain-containing protein [Nocardioides sp. SYSU D00038]|uniref:winged helix DNA-binding domain-containing protein n=1 Tax=Nocardioides sp. SYSU D00038 TaxID=2812554 RepID=UPI0019683AEF|nr:winged helix DNA-binding domain-containing protein [Nocardioides sp. SYSU D00038]
MRHVPDRERRARLARRHAVAPGHRVADTLAAVRAMTVLHATEPASVHLAVHARVDGVRVDDVDHALHVDRSVVKQLAMRRTVFVFPRDLLPAAWGSASARVAGPLAKRLAAEAEAGGVTDDGEAWLAAARAAVLRRLADGSELTAQALREELPELAGRVDIAAGTPYAANVALSPRVLTQLGVEGLVCRGRNASHWRVSRPQWTLMSSWLGEVPPPLPEAEGYAELVRRWLRTFGPGTEADLVWWLGSTKAAVRRALADVGAVEVSLDGGATGWLLPDDLEPEPEVEPWAALLPVLDPTVMGWKERAFYLGDHAPRLFDRNGNAGTTAWWDGRIVGCWVQDAAGRVEVALVEDVPAAGRAALEVERRRLDEWLDGVRVGTVYPSLAMKEATR